MDAVNNETSTIADDGLSVVSASSASSASPVSRESPDTLVSLILDINNSSNNISSNHNNILEARIPLPVQGIMSGKQTNNINALLAMTEWKNSLEKDNECLLAEKKELRDELVRLEQRVYTEKRQLRDELARLKQRSHTEKKQLQDGKARVEGRLYAEKKEWHGKVYGLTQQVDATHLNRPAFQGDISNIEQCDSQESREGEAELVNMTKTMLTDPDLKLDNVLEFVQTLNRLRSKPPKKDSSRHESKESAAAKSSTVDVSSVSLNTMGTSVVQGVYEDMNKQVFLEVAETVASELKVSPLYKIMESCMTVAAIPNDDDGCS